MSEIKTLSSIRPTSTGYVSGDHIYETPAKLIRTVQDMKLWHKSEAYCEYLGFILAINDAVKGKSNSKGSENASEEVKKLVNLLEQLDEYIDSIPPVDQPQRFGNIAFRTWHQNLVKESLQLLQVLLPAALSKCIPEVVSYLVDAFGNPTRIDYGTGHEIAFVMFLCCLFKVGFLKDQDRAATGCLVFPRYLYVAQKLQKTYRMEPAGSHGVWSLDDFQFVPFIWGSSQLFAHPQIEPASFLQPKILDQYADNFLFLTCIRYINSVKTGPFAEHSNQLWSISGVPSWSKINNGLIKMYKAEVLSKFPVIQHIVFGSLFTLKPVEHTGGFMSAKTSMVRLPIPTAQDTVSLKSEVSAISTPKSIDATLSDTRQEEKSNKSPDKSLSDKSQTTQES